MPRDPSPFLPNEEPWLFVIYVLFFGIVACALATIVQKGRRCRI